MTTASRDLELLVAKIQQQLAPTSEVIHNARLEGRLSGTSRQIDVLLRDRIGQFEMKIVIEAKDHARPVDVKGVEEFAGLVADVGAHRGVLVSPNGFTEAAKTRAKGFQIDVYSPVDTDPHKWQATVTMPAVIDFRAAKISFGVSMSAPFPFRMMPDFFTNSMVYDSTDNELGTIAKAAIDKWNSGSFPIEPGVHERQPIFATDVTRVDNGYDAPLKVRTPVDLYAGIWVEQQLYYGQIPVSQISGFYDHQTGLVITNAFALDVVSPEEVEETWLRIDSIANAPVPPVLTVRGLWAWSDV
jgi:Restriction endonuclease